MGRAVQIFSLVLLALPLSGNSAFRYLSSSPIPPDLQASWLAARNLVIQRNYSQAIVECERLAQSAHNRGLYRAEARLRSVLASAQTASFQYRQAAQTYLRAQSNAERAQDWPMSALISFNLSNVYFHLGALNEAAAAAAHADQLTGLGGGADHRIGLAIHKARLASRIEGPPAARKPLQDALSLARASGDTRQIALVQELTAVQQFATGDLEAAAATARDACALRRKSSDVLLSSSLLTLSRILLSQGRPNESLDLVEQAFAELKKHSPQRPLFRFYQLRGEAKAALGQWEPARIDLRAAIEHLRLLRPEVIPAEAIRMRAAASHQEVFTTLAEVCNQIYLRSRRPDDLWEAFAAANENRAWTMRQIVGRRADPSPAYVAALTALQNAELQALRESTPESLAALSAARLHISELEFNSSAGPTSAPSAHSLRQFQSKLPPGTAVVQFQTGVHRSYAWALTKNQLSLLPLASSETLQAAVRRTLDLIEREAPEAASASHELYQSLFGKLPSAIHSATRWTLLPDQFLYQIPFAALVTRMQGAAPHYLIEDVALQLTPFLADPSVSSSHTSNREFIGFGDPIYNSADSRWLANTSKPPWLRWAGFDTSRESNSLPRLPGTALEVQRCARSWNGPSSTFTGAGVSGASLRSALSRQPEVVHLATHLVPGAADPSESRLMLSLSPSGEPELLDPIAISHLRAQCPLIVMSGCRAGAAGALAGEGLLGLSRAWLAAGASSVLATQWAMPDDSGEMWDSFYSAWRASTLPPGAARASVALQSAQQELIVSNSWRSRPRFWASYFVIGSN